ncbi:hypothetical protein CEXT_23881 [Caerostris extrusa]|uniref:Uncharacterized protein n=1 Tax=Caerostris extrusa TaxID=172846 RepID=A0AAV4NY88_CAEEX|nr:hypothetical protein CEXT_23881 [Caerostris extrusa]
MLEDNRQKKITVIAENFELPLDCAVRFQFNWYSSRGMPSRAWTGMTVAVCDSNFKKTESVQNKKELSNVAAEGFFFPPQTEESREAERRKSLSHLEFPSDDFWHQVSPLMRSVDWLVMARKA